MDRSDQDTFNHVRATSLSLVREQSMILENQASERMAKRRAEEDAPESSRQRTRYSVDNNNNNDDDEENEPNELVEFDSFITEETDNTYNPEETVEHGDNLKTKTYTLTMYEMNLYEKCTNAFSYDDHSTLDERWVIVLFFFVTGGDTLHYATEEEMRSLSCSNLNAQVKSDYELQPVELKEYEFTQTRRWRLCVRRNEHYFSPQATDLIRLYFYNFLSYVNQTIINSNNQYKPEDKSEIGIIVDNVSPMFRYLFPSGGAIGYKWDKSSFVPKSTQANKKLRLDLILYHKNQEIGCGEVKGYDIPEDLLNNDRARIAETMKRQLHSRILNSKDKKEHVTFGVFCFGDNIELHLMAFEEEEETPYQLYELVKLKSPTTPTTYTSMEETLEFLLSFKNLMSSTLVTDEDVEKPCIYSSFTHLLRLS